MDNLQLEYFDKIKENIYSQLSFQIQEKNIEKIIKCDLYESHIQEPKSLSFQKYYFRILKNETLLLTTDTFFKDFKKNYSLQGIDNEYLAYLNQNKEELLHLIHEENLVKLYLDFFRTAKIKHGNKKIEKDLGSFFAKFVHTFNPEKYCALDNPIKEGFGLAKESFFISFLLISNAYLEWTTKNSLILQTIKENLKNLDIENVIDYEKLTNLKLLDLIFWSKTNRVKK